MQIPMYWSRAVVDEDGVEIQGATEETFGFQGIGWSDISESDAYDHALKRARNTLDRYERDIYGMEDLREQYYADRPLREPIVDELHHEGHRIAVITRNVYGAYVLNAANALFIDIDVPKPRRRPKKRKPKQPGFFARLFGATAPEPEPEPLPEPPKTPEDQIRDTIEQMSGIGMKLYKMPNGFRALVTHQPYDPAGDASRQLLQAFDADKLYAKLCQAQQCYRARLTPKPWRIGMDLPPKVFPFTSPAKQRAYEQWDGVYESRCQGFAACEAVSDEPWGNPVVDPAIAPVLAMHDELACSLGKALA